MRVRKHYHRGWLNRKTGRAYVICRATVSEDWVGGSLELGDCGSSISLDFECHKVDDIPERLAKIDRIRAQLDVLEDFLLEGLAVMPTQKERVEIAAAKGSSDDTRYISIADL